MREYKIRDGQVVEFREGAECREVSTQHQGYLAWLAVGNTPEDLPPLPGPGQTVTAAAARAAINAKRDATEFGIFTDTHGHRYDVDRDSRDRLTGAVVMASAIPPTGFEWTDADNIQRPHTGASLVALAGEILLWTDAVHRHAVDLKGKLDRGEAYDITTGWPV